MLIGIGGKLLRSGEPLGSSKTNASVSSFCLLPTSPTPQQQKSTPSLLAKVTNNQQLISITSCYNQTSFRSGGLFPSHPLALPDRPPSSEADSDSGVRCASAIARSRLARSLRNLM